MLHKNLQTVTVAVFLQISACAQIKSFIHSNMNPFRGEAFGNGGEHIVDEPIIALVPYQQHILAVHMAPVFLPTGNVPQMGKHLNTGNQFDTDRQTVSIHFLYFGNGIPTAHITEVGLIFHFVGIFSVKHHGIIAHFFDE